MQSCCGHANLQLSFIKNTCYNTEANCLSLKSVFNELIKMVLKYLAQTIFLFIYIYLKFVYDKFLPIVRLLLNYSVPNIELMFKIKKQNKRKSHNYKKLLPLLINPF